MRVLLVTSSDNLSLFLAVTEISVSVFLVTNLDNFYRFYPQVLLNLMIS